MTWILRVLWLVVAYDLSESRRMADVVEKFFYLFCPTWCTVLKSVCEIIPDRASEDVKKSLVEAVYEQEKQETQLFCGCCS